MTGVWLRSKVNSMVLPGSSVFQERPELKLKIKIKIIYAGSGIGYFVLKLRNKKVFRFSEVYDGCIPFSIIL
jgi:hypothetical protein